MRWIFRFFGVVVVLVILALGMLAFLPGDKIASFAAREISARTGREVVLSGEVSPVFYPVLGVRTGPVSVANADWSDGRAMIKADGLLVGVELIPLLSGTVKIKELRVENPVIRLEKAKDGRGNWELGAPGKAPADAKGSDSGGLAGFSLADGQIINGTFHYVDHLAGSTVDLNGLNLAVSLPDSQTKVSLKGGLDRNGERIEFSATIEAFSRFLEGGLSDLSLDATGAFGDIAFKGRAGYAPAAAEGDILVALSNPKAAMRLAGLATELPAGMAKTARLSAKLTVTDKGAVFLRGMALAVDGNKITGDVDVVLAERVMVTAKLMADVLDFSAMTQTTGTPETKATNAPSKWSSGKIDASGLNAIDADIVLHAAALDLGSIRFDAIKARAKIDKGRLVVDLGQARAYEGTIAGNIVVNARKGLSLGGDLSANKVQLRPLLKDMAHYDRLAAGADIKMRFLASGNSVKALMNTLSGSGSVETGAGEIIGFDLLGMLKTLDTSFRGSNNKTVFNSIEGTFAITDGVLENQDLVMQSPILDALGAGTINVAKQNLKYRATLVSAYDPVTKTSSGATLPIAIEGPWGGLSYKADLEGLARQKIDPQVEEAKQRLKANVDKAKQEAEVKLREEADKALKEGADKLLDDLLNRVKKP